MGGGAKVAKSALAVLPPVALWDGIQAVRQRHDKGFYRWMPHVNVLYPFYEDSGGAFEAAAQSAESALRAVRPFRVRLASTAFFEHSRRSCTVWLDPCSALGAEEGWQALHDALLGVFPECTDLSCDPKRNITGFKPHLSLGGWPGRKSAEQAIEELSQTWEPVEFVAESVHLISRGSYEDSFKLRWEVPLGGGGNCLEKNLRYAAVPAEESGSGGSKDSWAKRSVRPAAGQFKKVDMHGLPWGLFQRSAVE